MSKPVEKQYLGDGVYARDDGFNLVLTTENGISVQNKIELDPRVIDVLLAYIERMKEVRK